jgi:hypothetical protein
MLSSRLAKGCFNLICRVDQAISKWLSGGVSTEDSVLRWIQSINDNWASDGPRFAFAIQTEDEELVGMYEVNVD